MIITNNPKKNSNKKNFKTNKIKFVNDKKKDIMDLESLLLSDSILIIIFKKR